VRTQIGHGIGSVFKIIFNAFRSELVFGWFASVYSAIGVVAANITGTKSVIVIGGVDVAREPELGYGIWLSPWKAILLRYALRHADLVLAVDPCLRESAMRLAEYDGQNILYLPTGYNSSFWKPVGEKEPLVLTVAVVSDERRLKVKGIDLLMESARLLRDVPFVVIGVSPRIMSRLNPPENVRCYDAIERSELLPYYRRARVFCQPSRLEGLANTLCEAMACGCVPVATDVGGNRTAVGDAGMIVPSGDVQALSIALREALKLPDSAGAKARARIVSLFPKEKRENELLRLIRNLLQ
jgi:glycosyltransferase involved in cell wall biosynthesis